jgi:hypothetical protein
VLLTAILVTLIVRKTLVKFLINWIQNNPSGYDLRCLGQIEAMA